MLSSCLTSVLPGRGPAACAATPARRCLPAASRVGPCGSSTPPPHRCSPNTSQCTFLHLTVELVMFLYVHEAILQYCTLNHSMSAIHSVQLLIGNHVQLYWEEASQTDDSGICASVYPVIPNCCFIIISPSYCEQCTLCQSAILFQLYCVQVFHVTPLPHRQHRGVVTGLVFSPTGHRLYSSSSSGSLAMYDSEQQNCRLVRLMGNTTARGEYLGPRALCLSEDGGRLVFIGPLEFTVTMLDADTLDEVTDRWTGTQPCSNDNQWLTINLTF